MRTRMQFIACQIAWMVCWYFFASAMATVAFDLLSARMPELWHFWMHKAAFLHPFISGQSFLIAYLAFMVHITIEKRAKKAVETSDEMAKANIDLALAQASADHQFFHDVIAKLMPACESAAADAKNAPAALNAYREASRPNEETRKKTMDEAKAAWKKALDVAIALYKPHSEKRALIDVLVVLVLLYVGRLIT